MTDSLAGGRPGVFLDRDGTINEDLGYVHTVDRFILLPGVREAIRRLNLVGIPVVVVTNQSGIGRGMYSEEEMHTLHRHLDLLLQEKGAWVDGYLFCPHHPTDAHPPYRRECDCRKPAPGLLREGAERFGLDLGRSFMVGDKVADMNAARAAGCHPVLVRTGHGRGEESRVGCGVAVVDDLPAAVDYIMNRIERSRDGD
ncbi:MAG: D-glycero-beta-D-manno-heptose 1,7-bisphosphate 7-phosphatase [Desulfuromonadia bacterium]